MDRFEQRGKLLRQMRKRDTEAHYREAQEARSKGTKVVWGPGAPHAAAKELFNAMGVKVISPENYSTILCAKQMAKPFCEAAESKGLSRDLCAYGRCINGMIELDQGPYGPLPVPDMLVLDTAICGLHGKMWEGPAFHYRVPFFRLDGAFRFNETVEKAQVDFRVSQLKRMVEFTQEQLHVKFDYDLFKENMRRSIETYRTWDRIQKLRRNVPCPRTTREMAGDVFYLIALTGTREAAEYFDLVLTDVQERVAAGKGMVPNERFRIFYDNIPVWYRLQLIDYLQERGAAFVFDSFSGMMFGGPFFDDQDVDPAKPFEALALLQLYDGICMSIQNMLHRHARAIEEWKVDGAISLVNRSCRMFSGGVVERDRMYRDKYGIPTLIIEAEMADPRSLNEEEVKRRFDDFLSLMESRKGTAR